jgi:putative tryptophan/tyrosine transport system substrate-binding protein
MASYIRRRKFLATLGGAVVAWPLAARAQQPMPVIAFIDPGTAAASAQFATAFRQGLNETGYSEGRNVAIEYHWLDGQYGRLPALTADLVGRRVAVIVTPGSIPVALAAKAATAAIPILFGVGEDPVKLGLVANLARPGGNLTGVTTLASEVGPKRLELVDPAELAQPLRKSGGPIQAEGEGRTVATEYRWAEGRSA